jgi:hypothetical protein
MDNPYVEVDLFGPSNSSPTQLDAKMTKLKHSIFLHSVFCYTWDHPTSVVFT